MIILVAETSLLDSTRLMTNWTSKGAWAAAGASFLLLYWGVISRLVHDWANDDNYSHGFLIVPLALYFAWERRDRVAAAGAKSNLFGLLVVAAGLAMLVVG